VVFALLLNEIGSGFFKKLTQSVSYLPHFISWVVVSGIWYKILSYDSGLVNELLLRLGMIREPILFMGQGSLFIGVVVLSDIWKGMGWSAIIYVAALASIDQNIYEAAMIDGAGRLQRALYISVPGIMHVIVILAVFAVAGLLNAGFDQMQTFLNPMVMDVGDIVDTFILRQLTSAGVDSLSLGAAAGLFQSFIGLCLFLAVNSLARRFTGESIM
jgi:putative aldouronate transport system permease protein